MARGIYVGINDPAYLSTNISNTSVRKYVTEDYAPYYGFKIKFVPKLISESYQHILNVGGVRGNTIMCLSLYNGIIQLEAPTTTTASSKNILARVPYEVNKCYEMEYIVLRPERTGTFKINGEVIATLSNISVNVSPIAEQMCLFNSAVSGSDTDRPTQIDWYYLQIHEGSSLRITYLPEDGPAIRKIVRDGDTTVEPISNVTYTAAVDTAHKVNKVYIGENGVARNVSQVYVGNLNNEAALSFGTSGPQALGFSVVTASYSPSEDYGKVILQFNQDITLVQDTGEDPIQVMLDDHQGMIRSLVYYPGYDSTIQVVDGNQLHLTLAGGTFIQDDPYGIELEIHYGVITSQNTGEILGYIRMPLPIEILV